MVCGDVGAGRGGGVRGGGGAAGTGTGSGEPQALLRLSPLAGAADEAAAGESDGIIGMGIG